MCDGLVWVGGGASSRGLGESSESNRATAWATGLGHQRGKKNMLLFTLIRLCEINQQTAVQFGNNLSNVLCVHVHASFMPGTQQLHHRRMDTSLNKWCKISSRIGSGGWAHGILVPLKSQTHVSIPCWSIFGAANMVPQRSENSSQNMSENDTNKFPFSKSAHLSASSNRGITPLLDLTPFSCIFDETVRRAP